MMRNISNLITSNADNKNRFTHIDTNDNSIRLRLPILGAGIAIEARVQGSNCFEIGAIGISPTGTRWLYDTLVTTSKLKVDIATGKAFLGLCENLSEIDVAHAIEKSAEYLIYLRKQEESASYDGRNAVAMYWSSGVLNFGDWAGPHIVSALSGRQIVQNNRPGINQRVLYSVGSILSWFKRNNVDVWGSGLMQPFSPEEVASRKKLTGIKIHAVRGYNTKKEIERVLDWDVPEIFGDPALLLPEFMTATKILDEHIAFVPHNRHRAKISNVPTGVHVVDVRKSVQDVVDQICSAKAVISSSLHGLIVAQAYGIPWVWLDVVDQQLGGNDFKFEDFFTTIDRNHVTKFSVRSENLETVNFDELASNATLPSLTIDLGKLRSAFPIDSAGTIRDDLAMHPAPVNK